MSSEQSDPQLLSQYLLGSLSDDETARLDELSITDEEFAWLLTAVEDDLVDSYVRGELSGETLGRFRAHYLSTPSRRDKVRFAEALRDFTAAEARDSPLPRPSPMTPRFVPAWAFAAAAVLALGVGYLFVANSGLRRQLIESRAEQTALRSQARDLERRLDESRAPAPSSLPREESPAQSTIERLQIISLVLTPPRRGPGGVPSVSVPPGTDVVALQLQLEGDEFPVYQAVLKASDNRAIWQSGKIFATRAGAGAAVTVGLPARVLASGLYSLELSGVAAGGHAEFLEAYAFRSVIR